VGCTSNWNPTEEKAVSTKVEPEKWSEFDLTGFVKQQAAGDKLLSIQLVSPDKGGSLLLSSREGSYKPHLVDTP
jgi:hypothetical protein